MRPPSVARRPISITFCTLVSAALVLAAFSGAATAQDVLYDNGSIVTHPGAGLDGADWSVLQQADLGMSTYGTNASTASGFRIADDFVVPAGGWQLDTIELFGYQTGSGLDSTFTGLSFNIWSGSPAELGTELIYDYSETASPLTTGFSGVYRVLDSSPVNDRPVMSIVGNADTAYLPAGTYWVDLQLQGTMVSGPWVPPVTTLDELPTGNALQYTGAAWSAAADSATAAPFDYPFVLRGAAASLELQTAASQPAGGEVARGAQGVPVLAFSAGTVVAPGVDLTSLSIATVAADGTSPVESNPVAAVSLFLDADGDGVADDPNSPLASAAVAANGTATLSFSAVEVQPDADAGFVLAFDLSNTLASTAFPVAIAGLALLVPGLWLARRGRKLALAAMLAGTVLFIAACGAPTPTVEVEFRASVTAGSAEVATGDFAGEQVPVYANAVGPVLSAGY